MILCGKRGGNHERHWSEYRPSKAERTAKKLAAFNAVAERIREEGETEELMRMLDEHRTQKCEACRRVQKQSDIKPGTLKGTTRAFWFEISQGRCGGCGKEGVPLEWRHVRGERSTHNLGDHAYWAVHGGVEAMREEMKKCDCMCRNCAFLMLQTAQPERKYATLEEMPSSTPAQRLAIRQRRVCDEKYAYVAAIKVRMGECEDCKMEVREDRNMRVFVFAHRNAAGRGDHVAELCGNHRTLATAKPMIDAEVEKSRLLCQTCHSIETRARNRDLTEDELFG